MQEKSTKDIELIERYLDFDLTETELATFNQRLKNEAGFRQKLNQYEYAHKVVEELYDAGSPNKNKEKFLNDKKPNKESKIVRLNYQKYLIGIAASVALLVAALFLLKQPSQTSQQLAQQYWQDTKTSTIITLKGANDQEAFYALLKKGDTEFLSGNYVESLLTLSKIPETYPKYNTVRLLEGQNYIELKEFEKAIEKFQRVIDNNGDEEKALWYQALAYIQNNNLSAAKSNLENIIKEAFPQQTKAKKLLDAIN